VLTAAGFSNDEELSEALDAYPAGKAPSKLKAVSAALGLLAGNKRRPTISYCLSQFLTDRARSQDTSSRTWERYEQQRKLIVSEFIKLIGDKDITEITRPEARSFVMKLEEEGKQPSTVEKYSKFMGRLTGWSLLELELTGTNQFSRLEIAKPADHDDDGVSFEYDEVTSLLAMTGSMNEDLQDIVRLLACTGARLAEITGLEVRDVLDKDDDGVILAIRFNGIRRLKNQKSIRTVPVVDQKSVQALRTRIKGHDPSVPVFPRYGRDGGPDAASAILSKWLTTIGLRDPKAKKPKTTHSLRHTFKDALRDANVTRDIANKIQGHTEGDAADGYGSLELLARKREGMEKAWKLLAPPSLAPAAALSHELTDHQEAHRPAPSQQPLA
jgi:integrase